MWRQEKHKWRKQRYGDYYERLMEPIHRKEYEDYIQKIKSLKEDIIALEPIPQNENQLIKTLQYFNDFINVVTKFADSGIVIRKEFEAINSTINDLTFRKCARFNNLTNLSILMNSLDSEMLEVQNKAIQGEKVTFGNLYLGAIYRDVYGVSQKAKYIEGKRYLVYVELEPIQKWINSQVFTVSGQVAKLKQKSIAKLNIRITKRILTVIDEVLLK